MYRRHILCALYGAVEGEWGSKLPISLHYLAQGEGQGGGFGSVPLIRSSPPPPYTHTLQYQCPLEGVGSETHVHKITNVGFPPPHPLQYQWSLEGWALKLMYIKLPMYLFFLNINLMILMRANQLLCGLVCLLDCTLYIIFVVIHPTEYI